ncbi:hypothetical protein BKA70DRAFT_1096383, partial [Coprinopsis sp. MPI-PUGE-AT-0042]
MGYTFTPSQQAYLREKREGYNGCTSKKRNKYSKQVAEHLAKELEKHSKHLHSTCPATVETDVSKAVRAWFKHHSEPAKREKGFWSGKWHARRVFMKLNGAQIVALADKMVDGDVDVGEFLEEWEENPVDVSEIEKRGRNPKKKGKKGEEGDWFFNHYQDAATLLMRNMDDDERARYAALADKWNSTGPPPEVQAQNADKHLNNCVFQFTKHIKKEYGAVAYMLVGFKSENGKTVAVQMEFNEDLGQDENFSSKYPTRQPFTQFRNYVWDIFKEGDDDDDEAALPPKQKHSKDLMPMKRNSYYEPILPSPTERGSEARGEWYCRAIRSFFTYHYDNHLVVALAMGNPKGRPRCPWKRIAESPRSMISEQHMDDSIAELLKEPSEMRVNDRVRIFDFLYQRQSEGR